MVDYCQVASRYTQQELIILINGEGWALNNILKGASKTERWGQKQKADHGTMIMITLLYYSNLERFMTT